MENPKNSYTIKTVEKLSYYIFNAADFNGTVNGFFSRRGGVSSKPLESLNLGGGIGDTRENIIENRRRILTTLGRSEDSIFDVWQVHSTKTIFTKRARGINEDYHQADAIFTNNPEVTLLMRFADCVPVLLYHPVKRIVGILHAGWKGTLNRICLSSIKHACRHFSTIPEEWIAGIGPSIGPDHYQVGTEIVELANKVFGDEVRDVISQRDGQSYLNLWEANRYFLKKAGVKVIYSMDVCTACDTGTWYSHRAENGKTGRFAGVIGLE